MDNSHHHINPQESTHHQCFAIDSQGKKILNPRYTYIEEIYRCDGSATIVHLVNDSITNTTLVAKRIEKHRLFSEIQHESAKREIEIHRSLNHSHTVTFFDGGEGDDEYILLMEFVERHEYFINLIETVACT